MLVVMIVLVPLLLGVEVRWGERRVGCLSFFYGGVECMFLSRKYGGDLRDLTFRSMGGSGVAMVHGGFVFASVVKRESFLPRFWSLADCRLLELLDTFLLHPFTRLDALVMPVVSFLPYTLPRTTDLQCVTTHRRCANLLANTDRAQVKRAQPPHECKLHDVGVDEEELHAAATLAARDRLHSRVASCGIRRQ